MESLGLENMLQLILVKEGVRPAFLLQPADYKERTGDNPRMKTILEAAKRMFPDLKQSDQYESYQGTLISKQDYNGRTDIQKKEMGRILGYPCFTDVDQMDPQKTLYGIDVMVSTQDGNQFQLFGNRCADDTKRNAFEEFARRAKQVFDKPEYKALLKGNEVKSVEVLVEKIIPVKQLVDKLLTPNPTEPWTQDEQDRISNVLFNFGFSMNFQFFFSDHFQYDNPVHRGILLGLLVYEMHNTLSPFFPIQKYPEQDKQVETIIQEWEAELTHVIQETKVNKPKTGGGGATTRKRRPRKFKKHRKTRKG